MNIHEHDKGGKKGGKLKILLDQSERVLLKDALFRYMNTYALTSPVLENNEPLSRDVDAFKLASRLHPSLLKTSSTSGEVGVVIHERHAMSLIQIAQYNERCTLPDLAQTKNPERCDQIRAIGNFCIELTDQVLEHFDNQNLNQLVPTINE